MPLFRNALLLCATPMLLAHAAQAQSNSCELLKQTLASRIPPEIKGYAMDDVPARTPVPPGGKVIGTCEGGARKVIYRRFGGAPLVVDGAAASGTASAPSVNTAPPAPKPASAAAVAQKDAPTAAVPKEAPKETPKPRPEPVVPPKLVTPPVASTPAPTPAKPAATPPPAAVQPPAPAPVAPPVASAPPMLARPAAIEKPAEPPLRPEPTAAPLGADAAGDDTPGFFSLYGRWLWLLLALPLVAWLWNWVAHRMAYDKAGLPRGPRL